MGNPWHPWNAIPGHPEGHFRPVGLVIDGRGDVITTGYKKAAPIPYDGMIVGWYLLADQTGSIVIDVWKDVWSAYPPTVADTIAGSEKPTLVSQQQNQDHDLTTWTRRVAAGDVIAFNVDSASILTQVHLQIRIRPD
jgi:hypothetical protein